MPDSPFVVQVCNDVWAFEITLVQGQAAHLLSFSWQSLTTVQLQFLGNILPVRKMKFLKSELDC